jgi:3-deoxy-D-manno-octulosonate 8-phosphate phosphatase KdsC-like HAD superfamily phosphatase
VPARARSKISLVLADVDGTLVTAEKVLTSRAGAAVKALHAAGIGFAITSGRPPRGMAMLIDPLALRTPVAGSPAERSRAPRRASGATAGRRSSECRQSLSGQRGLLR